VSQLVRQALLLIAVFVVVTVIAELAGAKNLGTAMTFGQVAFGLALVGMMLFGPRDSAAPDVAADAE
jgi:hypothetical protein